MNPIFCFRLPRSFYLFWGAVFLLKITVVVFLPPVEDEAYYWVWGRHPALCYLDHPGMIGWMNIPGLAPAYFRIPFVILNQLSVLVLACTGFMYFRMNEKQLFILQVLFNLIPVIGAGACLALPDSILIFFWVLAMHFSLRLLMEPDDPVAAALLGLSFGIGFCSKYIIVLAPLAVLLFCLFHYRRGFKSTRALLMVVIFGTLSSLPVLIWNSHNDWISFRYQLHHGLDSNGLSLSGILVYCGSQILIMSPFLFLCGFRYSPGCLSGHLIKYFAFVPLGFFLLTSMRTRVEANWASVAMPGIVLIGALNSGRLPKYAILYFSTVYAGVFTALLACPGIVPRKVAEPFAMRRVASETSSLPALYGANHQIASQLWLQQNRPVYQPKGISRLDMYDLWDQPALPERFHLVYKTSSGIPAVAGFQPREESVKNIGIYSVVELARN